MRQCLFRDSRRIQLKRNPKTNDESDGTRRSGRSSRQDFVLGFLFFWGFFLAKAVPWWWWGIYQSLAAIRYRCRLALHFTAWFCWFLFPESSAPFIQAMFAYWLFFAENATDIGPFARFGVSFESFIGRARVAVRRNLQWLPINADGISSRGIFPFGRAPSLFRIEYFASAFCPGAQNGIPVENKKGDTTQQ